jgi:uncharacterized protein (DUF849 family)
METLDGVAIALALEAMRRRVAVPIGVSTGAWFLPLANDRMRAIVGWEVLPDFASVNFHEPGAVDIAQALLARGVGVEAGLWNAEAATVLVDSGLAPHCVRILLEPMEQDLPRAIANSEAIEGRLVGVAPTVPHLLHGFEATAWPVLDYAREHGYDIRMGLEDTLKRRDGTIAYDNEDLIRGCADIRDDTRA